jgi:hypothetical protein
VPFYLRCWVDLTDSSSLKQIDIEFMRQLHDKVNLIPIIAKADTMTDDELHEFKARVCLFDYSRSCGFNGNSLGPYGYCSS